MLKADEKSDYCEHLAQVDVYEMISKHILPFGLAAILLAGMIKSPGLAQQKAEQQAASKATKKVEPVAHETAADESAAELANRDVQDALAEYERKLQAVLKTRRKEEKAFVAQVVNEVRLEKLPKRLVDSAWIWVRDKRPNTRYPFCIL